MDDNKTPSLEDVYEYIGGTGWYQWYLAILMGLCAIPGAIVTYIVTFTQAEPAHRCLNSFLETGYNVTSPEIEQLRAYF